jgi:hypothetical protein
MRKEAFMCDYSLESVASRPAKVGDKVKSTRFSNSITRGFAAVSEPDIAVCLRPGTEIVFDQQVVYSRGFGATPPYDGYLTLQHRVARFRQIDTNRPNTHHDALEFPDGTIALVTMLREGLAATVLQLPADADEVSAKSVATSELSLTV